MDAEFLVEQLDFFCAEALQLEEGENIGRKLFAQGVVIIQLPGRNEGGDFFRDGLADAVNFLEPFLLHEPGKIVGQGFQGAGRIGVGTDFEGVLALEFQQERDLLQNLPDFVRAHGNNPLACRAASTRSMPMDNAAVRCGILRSLERLITAVKAVSRMR